MTVSRRTFLRGAVIAASTPAAIGIVAYDPLATAIRQYRLGVAAFAAIPEADLAEDEEAIVAATYGPAQDALADNIYPTTSLEGVREALRLALDEQAYGCRMAENAARSALAYLESLPA